MTTNEETDLKKKWGNIIEGYGGGFTAVPNIMLKRQSELGINSTELNVLMNLIRFWWNSEQLPFPDLDQIAREMGTSGRTLYRNVASLEKKGFIRRIKIEGSPVKYDLSGLVLKLAQIKQILQSNVAQ